MHSAAIVNKAAALMRAQLDDFAKLATRGMGNGIDKARGKRCASQVVAGMTLVDNIGWSDAHLPFGGIKGSGYGHEPGYIQVFVNKKLVRTGHLAAPT